jgi:hypothetical protein
MFSEKIPMTHRKELAMTEARDHRAILARVEQIIDLLRTRYVCDGWKLDEEGAERTLRYFRHCADGGRDNNREYTAAREFLYRNGQSLDWVIAGDPGGMICHAAAQSAGADPAPTAPRQRRQFQAIQGGRSR